MHDDEFPELVVVRQLINTARCLRAARRKPQYAVEAARWESLLMDRERQLLVATPKEAEVAA